MPNGNGPFAHGCWQPVPDLPGTQVFSYLRKVDTNSSNSYIIASGDLVAVIDPGGLLKQADELLAAIREITGTADCRILALLTHAHVDHCRVIMDHPFFRDPEKVFTVVGDEGANALATADTRFTQAALLGQQAVPVRAAIRLFARSAVGIGDMAVPLGIGGSTVRLTTAYEKSPDGRLHTVQTLKTESSCAIRICPAPGHSPDSVCIQAGSLLFIGDLLFAASPGIAGMYGWDRQALIRSVDETLALLKGGTVAYCFPGHGRVLTCHEAQRVLAGVKKDAKKLEGIDELSPEWAKETALYAEGLMDEVGEVFTIVAARLLFVSHILSELEEDRKAGEVVKLIDADRVDALLSDFYTFLSEYRAGGKVDVHVALKAGQVVAKLEQAFAQEELALVLDPGYLHRAGRLLNDYVTVLRGFRPPRMLQPVAAGEYVEGLVGRLKAGSTAGDNVLDAADDPAAFTRALVKRIARITVFDAVTCSCPTKVATLKAEADAALLGDVIRTLLEDIAGSSSGEIAIRVSVEGRILSITIESKAPGLLPAFRSVRRRFLESECTRSGGRIVWPEDTGAQALRIDLFLSGQGP